jgi:hypothetical protein
MILFLGLKIYFSIGSGENNARLGGSWNENGSDCSGNSKDSSKEELW